MTKRCKHQWTGVGPVDYTKDGKIIYSWFLCLNCGRARIVRPS